ncbi:hypothetical protein [Flavobacterium sp.]|uniref:hypothetical protein n=1 Tax=Flavobacterium sp. TaxID=239 RepID=UPI002B4B67F5|nr:hypothetical protein [Flavobacterium sp.]HLP64258.1 hypothetical protein [Flavobacterium sp.]
MKILIFENEISGIKDAFNDVNMLDFNNKLDIKYVEKSQNFTDFKNVSQYNVVFVDIELSSNSDKDGYGVIDDLLKNNYKKIIVLTGNMVKENLKNKGLDFIDILTKPILLDRLKDLIQKFSAPTQVSV